MSIHLSAYEVAISFGTSGRTDVPKRMSKLQPSGPHYNAIKCHIAY